MASIYYPTSASVYVRQVASQSLTEQFLNVLPDSIFVFSGSTAFTSSLTRAGRSIALCLAYSPVTTGADTGEIPVPYMGDGFTPVTWSVKRLVFRAGGVENSTSSINYEYSRSTGSFSSSFIGTVNLYSGSYEAFTLSTASIVSGDKLRFNVMTLGGATSWTVITELTS